MTKTLIAAGAASLLLAGAASAQTGSAQTAAPAAPAPAPAATPAAHPTLESPIEALLADAVTRAVVLKHLPGLDQHPAYAQFKGMTLRAVAPFSQGHITDAVIAAIDTDLKALPKA